MLLRQVQLDRGQHAQRLTQHVMAQLVCLGAHTITGLLNVCGQQFRDWSAHYRMYGCERVDPQRLFDVIRQHLCTQQPGPVVAALDDTRLRKTGTKIHGVKYTRDPLGPPFHVNFIRAQRFLQLSVAWPGSQGQARMIPVDWHHAPSPRKPGPTADTQQQVDYQQLAAQARISWVGVQRIIRLRQWMDDHDAEGRALWVVVDGSFSNGTVLKHLSHQTILVGRIRADAKLYHLPGQQPDLGRRRVYGDPAPTPEQLRQDDTHPWQHVSVYFGGRWRQLRAKRLTPLRWRAAGQHHDLQLIVIAPTPYQLSHHGKQLYRKPAYLICTDPHAPLQQVVQHYLWRWDIEANFRDEKTILGVGQAQVRTPAATQNVTAIAVAAYALLLLAAEQCRQHDLPIQHLPAPKWRRQPTLRATTMSLIQNLRYELWARSIHSSTFMHSTSPNTKSEKCLPPLDSALFFASRFT
jgi:hypothetical protein